MKKLYIGFIMMSLGLNAAYGYTTEEMVQAKAMLGGMTGEKIAAELVTATKPNIPMKVDPISSITGVSGKGKVITYKGSVIMDKIPEKELNAVLATQKKQQIAGLCSNPFIVTAFEKGVVMNYEYFYAKSNKLIGKTSVSIKDCSKN